MPNDLRALAQAVVDGDRKRDALPRGTIERERAVDDVTAASSAFVWAMARMDAEDILAALDAERAQGYARAMGEVVERCESTVRDCVHIVRSWAARSGPQEIARHDQHDSA